MSRLISEVCLAAMSLGRADAALAVSGPYLVLDLAAAVIPTRRAAAGAAGEATGGRPPRRPGPSMTATSWPPTAGGAARPGVAAGG
jgi:hypothetical protein